MPLPTRPLAAALLLSAFLSVSSAQSADWIHWRGPEQTGQSKEKGLPESFGVTEPGKDHLIWKVPFGGRSAPLVMKGRVYTIGGYDMSLPTEGERVMCFDAESGKTHWERRFNVFHTDIVSSRLGWTTLTADPDNERVFCHTTAGFVICFDKDGKELWRRQLTEEFGRVTGYGGRIVSPIFDHGLVIVGMISGSWGDQARGANRFVALDGKNGEVVWWSTPGDSFQPPLPVRGTYYSNPVVAVVNGQRLLITGGGDGYVHALKLRTGERAWSFRFSVGVINPSPVVDGNLVYFAHGEENPGGGPIGRVTCLDASQVDPKTKEPKVVWDAKGQGKRFGLASPALADGLLYVPDDASELYCFDARTKDPKGKVLWRAKYGTVSRGAPLVADGKLYVFDVNARMSVFKLNGKEEPEELAQINFRRTNGVGFVETHGTPIAVNGKLYFLTQDDLYCVGMGKNGGTAEYKPLAAEPPYQEKIAPAGVRIFPADVLAKPGETVKFSLAYVDANGRPVQSNLPDPKVEWSLPQPPKTPTGAQPPALQGKIEDGTLTVGGLPTQQGYVEVKVGPLTGRARVRVAAQLPYSQDFEKVPPGGVPGGWVNAQGKYAVVDKNGSKVLAKVNTDSRPPIARANGYITGPTASDYTIEADVMGTEVRGRLPDMGVVNSRYTLILDGKSDSPNNKRQVRIVSWEARMRVNEAAEFDWQPGTWYRVKLSVDPATGTVTGKVWKKGDAEPAQPTLTYKDPSPNKEGAAAVYAYIPDPTINAQNPGSDVFFDNVSVTANGKK